MITVQGTVLAELAGEHEVSAAGTAWQPAGVRLDNDGCYRHWLTIGQRWTLTHDGTGWRAAHPGDDGHVRRLADDSGPHGSFVGWLPSASGERLQLDPSQAYVVELAADAGLTRTVIRLSILD